VEPVETAAYARLIASWQGVTRKSRGLEGLLQTIETLQGAALPAAIFESEILAGRIDDYRPSDLDTLSAAGEIVWAGVGEGRIALYLTDHLPLLHVIPTLSEAKGRDLGDGRRADRDSDAVHLPSSLAD